MRPWGILATVHPHDREYLIALLAAYTDEKGTQRGKQTALANSRMSPQSSGERYCPSSLWSAQHWSLQSAAAERAYGTHRPGFGSWWDSSNSGPVAADCNSRGSLRIAALLPSVAADLADASKCGVVRMKGRKACPSTALRRRSTVSRAIALLRKGVSMSSWVQRYAVSQMLVRMVRRYCCTYWRDERFAMSIDGLERDSRITAITTDTAI